MLLHSACHSPSLRKGRRRSPQEPAEDGLLEVVAIGLAQRLDALDDHRMHATHPQPRALQQPDQPAHAAPCPASVSP